MNKKDNKQKKDNHCHNRHNCPGEGYFGNFEKIEKKTETKNEEEITEKFINDMLTESLIKINLVLLFNENEYYLGTTKDFANQIKMGKDENLVKEIIDDLVEKKIMEKMGEGESAIYSLDNNLRPYLIEKIEEVVKKIERKI